MKGTFYKLILVIGAVALMAAVLYLPKTPSASKQEVSAAEAKIERAKAMVQNGSNPMEGIMLLREVLEEDPGNTEAHYQLGLFSMQSGQWDKAVERFETVVSKKDPTYNDALFYLGQAYASTGQHEKAISVFNQYKQTSADTAVTNAVDRMIKELSNKH